MKRMPVSRPQWKQYKSLLMAAVIHWQIQIVANVWFINFSNMHWFGSLGLGTSNDFILLQNSCSISSNTDKHLDIPHVENESNRLLFIIPLLLVIFRTKPHVHPLQFVLMNLPNLVYPLQVTTLQTYLIKSDLLWIICISMLLRHHHAHSYSSMLSLNVE